MATRNGTRASRQAFGILGRLHRFAFLFLVMGATALMILSRTDNVIVDRVSVIVIDVFAPIMNILSRPAATVKEGVETARELVRLRQENIRLSRENERLLSWQESARQLAAQNEVLQSLLAYEPPPGARHVTARVVGDSGGVFVKSVLVNAGTSSGISKGQAAVTGSGLVGRVTQAGHRSARILLITDINSRVPVLIESSRERAILTGDNSRHPKLSFLPGNAAIHQGDRIVTSGHGGVFPPGLSVGRVAIDESGTFRVEPFAGLDQLEYVRLVDYPRVETLPGPGKTRRASTVPAVP